MRRLFFQDIDALLVLHNRGQGAACGLKERGQFHLDEALLFEGVAHMAERWSHVERAARLALEEHVVASEMNLSRFAARLQLFQVSVAELALLVLLVADGLRVRNLLRHAGLFGWSFCGLVDRIGRVG